jgi:acyl carrier protein
MVEIVEVLIEKIKNDVLDQPNRKLKADDPLISSGVIDSFHLVDLSIMVQELFDVHIEDFELNAEVFDTVDELALLIQNRKTY